MVVNAKIVEFSKRAIPEASRLLSEAFRGCDPPGRVSRQSVRDLTIHNAGQFDEEASLVAQDGEELLGFVISFADRQFENDTYWHMAAAGWIGALVVKEGYRRRGIGSRLLRAAEAKHGSKGRPFVFVGGGESIRCFFPGIEARNAAGVAFVRKNGYRLVRRTCYVEAGLEGFAWPAPLLKQKVELEGRGIMVRKARAADKEAFAQYMKAGFFGEAEQKAVLQRFRERAKNMILAVQGGKHVIGAVSGYGVNARRISAYGGISVLPQRRNYGVGKILLAKVMEECARLGSKKMRLWTRPQTAERFYCKLGFEVTSSYDVYGKQLPQNFISTEWIARNRYL